MLTDVSWRKELTDEEVVFSNYQILSNQIPLPPQGQGWERIGWEPENVIVK